MCKEIGLADEIDRIVGVDPRQKVTCGEAVVAMVLNALGFVDRPLFLFPEFRGDETGGDIDKGRVESRGFHIFLPYPHLLPIFGWAPIKYPQP